MLHAADLVKKGDAFKLDKIGPPQTRSTTRSTLTTVTTVKERKQPKKEQKNFFLVGGLGG